MAFEVVEPDQFTEGGIFRQDDFVRKIDEHDWTLFKGKKVLVRGCGSMIIPPWAYMLITSRLAPYAKSIRYGNEHDHIVVFRNRQTDSAR